MNETLTMIWELAAGLLLGALFFGGGWWTARMGQTSQHRETWLIASLVGRLGIVWGGFYFVGQGASPRLMVCLLGFVIARLAVTWLTRPAPCHGE